MVVAWSWVRSVFSLYVLGDAVFDLLGWERTALSMIGDVVAIGRVVRYCPGQCACDVSRPVPPVVSREGLISR